MGNLQLSASGLSTLAQCGRKYEHRYIDRIESTENSSGPAALGNAFHAGARVIKDGGTDFLSAVRSELQYCQPVESILAEMMTLAWRERYKNDGLEYVLNEQEFDLEFQGVTIRGVFDGIAKNSDGEYVLVEHKTTGNAITPSATYWNRLDINHQLDIYFWAAGQIGYTLSHAIYDVVRWPKIFPEKKTPVEKREKYKRGSRDGKYGPGDYKPWVRLNDETMAEFKVRASQYIADNLGDHLVREPVYRSDSEIEKTLHDLSQAIKTVKHGGFIRNPWACRMGRKHTCEFHPVCTSQAELSNTNLYQVRKRR